MCERASRTIAPQVSSALCAKFCEHLRGQLSTQQLDDLDTKTALHSHRHRSGDAVVTRAHAAFRNPMHGELDPARFTELQFVRIVQRWIVRYSRSGSAACQNTRKRRTLLSDREWAEAGDTITAYITLSPCNPCTTDATAVLRILVVSGWVVMCFCLGYDEKLEHEAQHRIHVPLKMAAHGDLCSRPPSNSERDENLHQAS